MIEIKNVSKSYVKGKKSVDTLDLQIKNGEIFGFLGPNRSRKNYNYKDDNWYIKSRRWRYFFRWKKY